MIESIIIMLFISHQPALGDISQSSPDDIISRTRLLENDIRIMRLEVTRITHEIHNQKEKIKENTEKIKVNKNLPYLVSNVIEVRSYTKISC